MCCSTGRLNLITFCGIETFLRYWRDHGRDRHCYFADEESDERMPVSRRSHAPGGNPVSDGRFSVGHPVYLTASWPRFDGSPFLFDVTGA
jgi:hypothetical protein